jgi:cation transport regulator ChaC
MPNRDEPLWYFGYGSNMCRAIFLGRRAMQPLATCCGRLDGHRLAFDLAIGDGERGVANLVVDANAHTWGVLYQLPPAELDRLDRTEGVPHGVYDRVPVTVVVTDEATIAAVTYRSRHRRPGRKPSPRYMGLLLDGAREQALPDDYVRFLRAFPLAIDERAAAQGTLPFGDAGDTKVEP